jgi:hypothetical protein
MPIKPRVKFLAKALGVKFSRIARGIHAFLAKSRRQYFKERLGSATPLATDSDLWQRISNRREK